jgi:hypothetical protein
MPACVHPKSMTDHSLARYFSRHGRQDRDGVVKLLTGILIEEYISYTTTRNYDFLTG